MRPFAKLIWLGLLAAALAYADAPQGAAPQKELVIGLGKRYIPEDKSTDRPDAEKYSQDVAEMVARYMGVPYRLEFYDTTSDLLKAFDDGQIDLIPTVAHTPDRDSQYLFSVPHVRGSLVAVVRRDDTSIRSMEGLAHSRIGVVPNSYESKFIAAHLPEAQVVFYPRSVDTLTALRDGKLDAAVGNELPTLSAIYRTNLDKDVQVAFNLPDSVVEFGMIVHRGQDKLLAQVNDALFLAEQNGDLKRNYEKWFYTFDSSAATKTKIRRWVTGSCAAVLIIALFLWFLLRSRMRSEAKRREDIEGQVIERTRELQEALERLRQSQEYFAKAFKANPAAIGVVDFETAKFVEVNDQYPQIFGYLREELIGHTALELGLWGRVEDQANYRKMLKDSGHVRDLEVECRNRDGQRIVCTLNADVVELDGRKVTITTMTNITERKGMEVEKERLKAQLQHAQRLEAVGTLAGGVAHDFNNILTAIVANAELADLTDDIPTIRDHLNEVKQACQRAKDLVRRILTFSRREKHERTVVDMGKLLAETISLLRSTLPTNVVIRTQVDPNTPPLLADASQLHQVFVNLCTNAAHAMKGTGGTLSMGADGFEMTSAQTGDLPELKPGRYARIKVTDTGSGMDAETVRHIFEPFYTTKGPGEGTGLGLAVVHGIVQEHNGCVTVSSRIGEGTTVSVYLPAAPEGSRKPAPVVERTAPIGQAESVLLIDDDVMVLTSVKNMIEMALHYKVAAFNSPMKALAAFQRTPDAFNLVLTDLTMPGMTGIDLAGELLKVREKIPVILMTGYSDNWTLESVKELGLTDLIMKPVNLAELAWTLREALESEANAGLKDG